MENLARSDLILLSQLFLILNSTLLILFSKRSLWGWQGHWISGVVLPAIPFLFMVSHEAYRLFYLLWVSGYIFMMVQGIPVAGKWKFFLVILDCMTIFLLLYFLGL